MAVSMRRREEEQGLDVPVLQSDEVDGTENVVSAKEINQ